MILVLIDGERGLRTVDSRFLEESLGNYLDSDEWEFVAQAGSHHLGAHVKYATPHGCTNCTVHIGLARRPL